MMNKFDLDRTDPPILPAGLRRVDTTHASIVKMLVAWREEKRALRAFETGDHGQEQIKGTGQRLPMANSALTGKPMPSGIEPAVPVPPTLSLTWLDGAPSAKIPLAGVWRMGRPPKKGFYWVRYGTGCAYFSPVQDPSLWELESPWEWLDESPQPDADGWIAHTGDACPVPAGTRVWVRLRGGFVSMYSELAERSFWAPMEACTITHYRTDQP